MVLPRSSRTSEVLYRCPGFPLEDRRLRKLRVSFRDNFAFDLNSSLPSFPLLKASVGDGIGLSLDKKGSTRLAGGGESSSGGGRLRRLNSGLFGAEQDLWRTT